MKSASPFLLCLGICGGASFGRVAADPLLKAAEWSNIVSPLLNKVLSDHGDGPIVSNVKAYDRIADYVDLTTDLPKREDCSAFSRGAEWALSNVLDYGACEETIHGVRTENSYVTLSCICDDINCENQVAADITGALQVDGKAYRGMSPLLFMNLSNEKVPCLSLARSSLDDVTLEGCDLEDTTSDSNGYLPVNSCVDESIESLRVVEKSAGNLIARPLNAEELWPNLSDPYFARKSLSEIIQTFEAPQGTLSLDTEIEVDLGDFDLGDFDLGDIDLDQVEVGEINVGEVDVGEIDFGSVDLNGIDLGTHDFGEIDNPFGSDIDLGEIDFGDIDLGDVEIGTVDVGTVNFGTVDFGAVDLGDFDLGNIDIGSISIGKRTFPISVEQNITDLLQGAELSLIASVLDSLGSLLLPNSFSSSAPASEASLADYLRILLAFSIERLRAPPLSTRTFPLVSGNPLYLDLLASRPQTSPTAEIINGCVLLAFTAGLFGWASALLLFRIKNRDGQTNNKGRILAAFGLCLASTPAFVAESAAFSLRWIAERDLQEWQESMVLVDTTTASRVSGALPLTLGRDGNVMTVSVITARLSTDDPSRYWLFITGVAVAFAVLVIAFIVGYRYQVNKENRHTDGNAAGGVGIVTGSSANQDNTPPPMASPPLPKQEPSPNDDDKKNKDLDESEHSLNDTVLEQDVVDASIDEADTDGSAAVSRGYMPASSNIAIRVDPVSEEAQDRKRSENNSKEVDEVDDPPKEVEKALDP
mmetsp:Transcript_29749/g.65488  ORF Transcript_29749/g.65488 Transcript_29749/m.65488 type:complete len:759 (-) Transcript_29749:335-2611(-)